jgi:hypothetical protein
MNAKLKSNQQIFEDLSYCWQSEETQGRIDQMAMLVRIMYSCVGRESAARQIAVIGLDAAEIISTVPSHEATVSAVEMVSGFSNIFTQ